MTRIESRAESNYIAGLSSLDVPFATRAEADAALRINGEEKLELDALEREKLEKIVRVLRHPVLEHLINKGRITFAMIKPHADQGKDLSEDDEVAAKMLMAEIGEKNIIFSLPFRFTHEHVEKFYGPLKRKLSKKRGDNPNVEETNVWDQIMNFYTSGPTTLLLVHKNSGGVVEWLMSLSGPTVPSEDDTETIRGKHFIELPNNLVHRSSSISEVKREVKVLANILDQTLANHA